MALLKVELEEGDWCALFGCFLNELCWIIIYTHRDYRIYVQVFTILSFGVVEYY